MDCILVIRGQKSDRFTVRSQICDVKLHVINVVNLTSDSKTV